MATTSTTPATRYVLRVVRTPKDQMKPRVNLFDIDSFTSYHVADAVKELLKAIFLKSTTPNADQEQFVRDMASNFYDFWIHQENYDDSMTSVEETFSWTADSPNDDWYFSLENITPDDPVTKEGILAWASVNRVGFSTPGEVLFQVMSNWVNYSLRSNDDTSYLREALEEEILGGPNHRKRYFEMTADELATVLMDSVIPHLQDNHDELEDGAFDMHAMTDGSEIWSV